MTWALILAFARKNWQAILAAVLIAAFIGSTETVVFFIEPEVTK